jgi:hypothetical protein
MALESQGAKLFWGTTSNTASESTKASTGVGQQIGEVVGWNGPSAAAGEIDITHLGSTAKEFLIGLSDWGNVSLDVNFLTTDTVQTSLLTDMRSQTKRHLVIQLNDSTLEVHQTRISAKGYVKNFAITGKVDNKISGSITVRLAGACTFSSTI